MTPSQCWIALRKGTVPRAVWVPPFAHSAFIGGLVIDSTLASRLVRLFSTVSVPRVPVGVVVLRLDSCEVTLSFSEQLANMPILNKRDCP